MGAHCPWAVTIAYHQVYFSPTFNKKMPKTFSLEVSIIKTIPNHRSVAKNIFDCNVDLVSSYLLSNRTAVDVVSSQFCRPSNTGSRWTRFMTSVYLHAL